MSTVHCRWFGENWCCDSIDRTTRGGWYFLGLRRHARATEPHARRCYEVRSLQPSAQAIRHAGHRPGAGRTDGYADLVGLVGLVGYIHYEHYSHTVITGEI